MDRKEKILDFIKNELVDDPDVEVDESTSLFQERVLDSLSLVTIISFLEDAFDIKIGTSEVSIDNLDTVNNMAALLEKKLDA